MSACSPTVHQSLEGVLGLVRCLVFVLEKGVEDRDVGPPNTHADDPELSELGRGDLERPVH